METSRLPSLSDCLPITEAGQRPQAAAAIVFLINTNFPAYFDSPYLM